MIVMKGVELQGRLKAADHKCGPPCRQWPGLGAFFRFFLHFFAFLPASYGLMILAAPFVAAQPLLDA